MKNDKQALQARRSARVRKSIDGRSKLPRLAVHISLQHVYAQIIDDSRSITLTAASDAKIKDGTMIERAAQVGEAIAANAKKVGVEAAILDRGSKRYHGRVKALAEAAREKGLRI